MNPETRRRWLVARLAAVGSEWVYWHLEFSSTVLPGGRLTRTIEVMEGVEISELSEFGLNLGLKVGSLVALSAMWSRTMKHEVTLRESTTETVRMDIPNDRESAVRHVALWQMRRLHLLSVAPIPLEAMAGRFDPDSAARSLDEDQMQRLASGLSTVNGAIASMIERTAATRWTDFWRP